MPVFQKDQFTDTLDTLIEDYPEYASVLNWLKKEVEQSKAEEIAAKLEQLKEDDF